MSRLRQESLHHQYSNASLHSQPSLCSLQSPGGFPGLPPQPSFGEPASVLRHVASGGSLDSFSGSLGGMPSREDLRTSQHGFPAPLAGQPPLPGAFPPQQPNPQDPIGVVHSRNNHIYIAKSENWSDNSPRSLGLGGAKRWHLNSNSASTSPTPAVDSPLPR